VPTAAHLWHLPQGPHLVQQSTQDVKGIAGYDLGQH